MAVRTPLSLLRLLLAPLLAAVLGSVALGALAAPAHAADGYRYWNYWHLEDGSWAFSDKGANQFKPADGAVEGWRYGTSTAKDGVTPRADLSVVTFDAVCGDETAPAGQKRVALVIDPGTEADAQGAQVPEPTTACAVVPTKATGQQALESVGKVRADSGLLCGIDGYPAAGCGDPVKNAKVATDEASVDFALPASASSDGSSGDDTAAASSSTDSTDSADDGSSALPVVLVAVVVVLLGLGALLLRRRRAA